MKKKTPVIEPYMCSEYKYNGGVPPVYIKGVRELEAERIINELSIKHGSMGATSDITELEKALIESSASRGINYGFFWKDRPIITTPEMNEIWDLGEPVDLAFERLQRTYKPKAGGGHIYELIHVKKDPDLLHYVDVRRASASFDKRYMDLKYLANPWLNYVTPKYKKIG